MALVAFAPTRCPRQVRLAYQQGQHTVRAQFVVIVEVLVTQRQTKKPLRHQGTHIVLDQPGVAIIAKTGGDPIHQPQAHIYFPQQQSAAVGGNPSAVKTTDDFAPREGVKF